MQSNAATTAEIIHFPRPSTQSTKSVDEINERLLEMKIESIEDAISFLVPTFFEAYHNIGFSVLDDRKPVLIVELMRSMMYDHYSIYHPMDDFFEAHEEEINKFVGLELDKPEEQEAVVIPIQS